MGPLGLSMPDLRVVSLLALTCELEIRVESLSYPAAPVRNVGCSRSGDGDGLGGSALLHLVAPYYNIKGPTVNI